MLAKNVKIFTMQEHNYEYYKNILFGSLWFNPLPLHKSVTLKFLFPQYGINVLYCGMCAEIQNWKASREQLLGNGAACGWRNENLSTGAMRSLHDRGAV